MSQQSKSTQQLNPIQSETDSSQIKENTANLIDFSTLLEQYKLYVEMADRVSQRRSASNNYYLSITSALVVFSGLTSNLPNLFGASLCMISIAGIILVLNWLSVLSSFRQLSAAKFSVVHEMETHLPFAMYYKEQVVLSGYGRRYTVMTALEKRVPIVFLCLFSILLLIGIFIIYRSFRVVL